VIHDSSVDAVGCGPRIREKFVQRKMRLHV
jgi:hypothetical protein